MICWVLSVLLVAIFFPVLRTVRENLIARFAIVSLDGTIEVSRQCQPARRPSMGMAWQMHTEAQAEWLPSHASGAVLGSLLWP